MCPLSGSACLVLVLFLTASPLAAEQHAAGSCATRATAFLNRRLSVWQQRLGLADWKITIVMSSAHDLNPGTLGNINWDRNKKTAVIHVLAAADYRLACQAMVSDMEFTVVHELVHLTLSPLPRSPASRGAEERVVNQIAHALLRLDQQDNSLTAEVAANTHPGPTPVATHSIGGADRAAQPGH